MPAAPREMLSDVYQAIGQLVAQERRAQRGGKARPHTIPPHVAKWLLRGLEDFLDGRAKTLDQALGLKRGRGQRDLDLNGYVAKRVRKSLKLRDTNPPMPYKEIIRRHFPNISVNTLKGDIKRYRSALMNGD